jgi:hypothetical protein
MRIPDIITYLTGADYLSAKMKQENRLLIQASRSLEPILPIEAGFKTAARIYAERLKEFFIYPVIVASRLTGLDAAAKVISKKNTSKA